ncbi:hypothetical protein BB561_002711 [Smittium simulii]|uniref:RRM domain-containing protein n=1 Tax=Smittium simulii TaxID=133385 RepID=A0A2T9YPF6_9FUNG|nr:hypothetical protein BB561_002711 [Smittium simulii]
MNNYENNNAPNNMSYNGNPRNRNPHKPAWNNKYFDKKADSQRHFNGNAAYGNNSRTFAKNHQINNRKPFKNYDNNDPEARSYNNPPYQENYNNNSFNHKPRPTNFNSSWKDDHYNSREDKFKGGNGGYKRKYYFDRDQESSNDTGSNGIFSGNNDYDFRNNPYQNSKMNSGGPSNFNKFGNSQEKSQPLYDNRRSALGICAPPPPPEPIQGRSILVQISPPNIDMFSTISNQRGISFFNFQDLRSARTAWEKMQNYTIDNYYINVRYSLPKANIHSQLPSVMKFQGTILVVLEANYGEAIDQEDEHIFKQNGEIRSIYTLEGRQNTRVIEYFDLRSAESAYNSLHEFNLNGKGKLHVIYFWDGSLGGWPPLPPRNYQKNENSQHFKKNNNHFGSPNPNYGNNSSNQFQEHQNQPMYNSGYSNKKLTNQYNRNENISNPNMDNYGNDNYKKMKWNSNTNDQNNFNGGYSPNKPFVGQAHFNANDQGRGFNDYAYNGDDGASNNYQRNDNPNNNEMSNHQIPNYSNNQHSTLSNITALSTLNALSAISAIANSAPNNTSSPDRSSINFSSNNDGSKFDTASNSTIAENATNLQLISALIAQQQKKNTPDILSNVGETNIPLTQNDESKDITTLNTDINETLIENQDNKPDASQNETNSLVTLDSENQTMDTPKLSLPEEILQTNYKETDSLPTLVDTATISSEDNSNIPYQNQESADILTQVDDKVATQSLDENLDTNTHVVSEDIELLNSNSVSLLNDGSNSTNSKPRILASTKEGNAQIAELLDILSQVKNQ